MLSLSRLSTSIRHGGLRRPCFSTLGRRDFSVKKADDELESKTLKKADLVRVVAAAHDLSQIETKKILDTIISTISEVRSMLLY